MTHEMRCQFPSFKAIHPGVDVISLAIASVVYVNAENNRAARCK
jgi:hypothetical protein